MAVMKTKRVAYDLVMQLGPGSDRLATATDKRQCVKRLYALLPPRNCANPAVYWCAVVRAISRPLSDPTEIKHDTTGEIQALKRAVGYKEHQQIHFSQHMLERMELDRGVVVEVGFAGEHLEAGHQQFGGDVQSGGFAQIIYIRLEGKT